ILALAALYLLLLGDQKVWMVFGFFIAIFWFWWIMMSFRIYGFAWAIPIGMLLVALIYSSLFWGAAVLSRFSAKRFRISPVWFKALFLLTASFIHPFGFDWLKPELMFTESYFGVEKWHFAIVLLSVALVISRQNVFYLLLAALAYQPLPSLSENTLDTQTLKLVTTSIPIDQKWDPKMLPAQVDLLFRTIDQAVKEKKKLIVFPESLLPLFLNQEYALLEKLRESSKNIAIVLGALHWDEGVPRNSSYIFDKGAMQIADKVVLVPFGENNPLPKWLSRWVNAIFYDGAIDYIASSTITDYTLHGKTYRNAICYEACSEKLYINHPKQMIVLSNNGWFVPSIEPTQQRLLLQYYSRKYGTTIYHSINMSPSYIIQKGKVIWKESR
ncbi:MAG TPA: apolipoprotein N-acyltransferase, partial [Epsilonproteobacteria bacterium]|nr:apolipoprotein N-acyltransferase [Campylobacterota bacterium]